MRVPRVQFTVRRLLVLPIIASLGMVVASLALPARRSLTFHLIPLRFRVVDAATREPVALARIVIENLNLAFELGPDSEGSTAADGRARLQHRFLALEKRREILASGHVIFQGPWIEVTAAGYAPRSMPLCDLVGDRRRLIFATPPEATVSLQREQPQAGGLAQLEGDYIFGDGFVYRELQVRSSGNYHFEYGDDTDRHLQSSGVCMVLHGRLWLTPDRPASAELGFWLGNNLLPVRWADRTYLVPEKQRMDFCNAVNQGGLPTFMRSGRFVLRDIDRETLPTVAPEVPPEWSRFLLQPQLAGKITQLLPDGWAVLNLGAQDGLRAGMSFEFVGTGLPSPVTMFAALEEESIVKVATSTGTHTRSVLDLLKCQPVVGGRVTSRSSR